MDDQIREQVQYLGLKKLSESWNEVMEDANRINPSYHRFLKQIIEQEYDTKKEHARMARIKRARIPELFVIETFPFSKQPRLKKKEIMGLYDSMNFIKKIQDLIFIGPTGCGKTGLATSFLVHSINQGFRGYSIDFRELLQVLYRAHGAHNENKVITKLASYDILLIDELGYVPCEKEQAGLFFDLMKHRKRRAATIITTQLGFDEWGKFLQNTHLTSALLDRITENCVVFNMKDCISIRPRNVIDVTRDIYEPESST